MEVLLPSFHQIKPTMPYVFKENMNLPHLGGNIWNLYGIKNTRDMVAYLERSICR